MAGGRKQREREKERRKKSKNGASSSSQAVEEDNQGAKTISDKCMEAVGIGKSDDAAPKRDEVRRKLEELALDYPEEAEPCVYLSYVLVGLAREKPDQKAAQQYYIRQAKDWAKKAVDRVAPIFVPEYSVEHARLVVELASLCSDTPNYESLLEEAEVVCLDTMVTAQALLQKEKEMENDESEQDLAFLDDGIKVQLDCALKCRKSLIKERELKRSLGINVDKKDQDVDRRMGKKISTDKKVSVGEEEDCEKASHELGEKDISESSKLEVSPTQYRFANIAYIVVGKFKKLEIESTSFGAEYDENRATAISLVSFENERDSERYFDTLKEFKYDKIVEAYIVCDMKVMVEIVNADVETWLNAEYNTFLAANTNNLDDMWWNHIKDNFISIFRDVLLTLQFFFVKGAYCVDLADNISVVNGRSTKLYNVKVAEGDLRAGIFQNIDDLSHLMTTVLLKGCAKDNSKPSDCILEEGGVPKALRLFLRRLYDKNVLAKWDILWLLDEAFFWNDVEKHSFIRKMNSTKDLFKSVGYHKAMIELLGVQAFNSFFTPGSVEYKVYKFGLKLQETKEKEANQDMILPYRDNMFRGVVLYSKNIVFHYNDHAEVDLKYYEIVALVDDLFHGGCSMIRNVMAKEICEKSLEGVDLDFYLSTKPF